MNEKGFLPEISKYEDKKYLTTTCIIHFMYHDSDTGEHHLKEVTIAAIPNGMLQEKYNPTARDGIWLAGRNAPSLGEDFRVRLSFAKLKEKAKWRVQLIKYNEAANESSGSWQS